MQWCEIDGRRYHVVGGVVSKAVTNPTFDPIAKPGAMHDYFRGNPDKKSPLEFLREREPIRPAYRDHDARIEALDEQGLAACWLFPTLGMLYEELLEARSPGAVCLTFRAFNQWLDEDWGFAVSRPRLRRSVHLVGRCRLGRARARLGARPRAPARS